MTDPDDDDIYICPECNGSGESIFGPPGTGRCRRCSGSGEMRNYDCFDEEGDGEDAA